ncbi:unnamed protein product, partial [Meganyctiphanes norvegica]
EFVKENDNIICNEELQIKHWRRVIEDATKSISKRRIANEKVQMKNMEASKRNLEKATTKKTIIQNSNNIETVSTSVKQWMHEVSKEYDLNKFTPFDDNSSAPANILKVISNGKTVGAETTIKGTKSIAKLTSVLGKLHMHHF